MPLRSWRDHLPPGAGQDLPAVATSAGLPAAWAQAWRADPSARLLRFAGDPGSAPWVTAAELDERTAAAAETLVGLGIGQATCVVWVPDRSLDAVVSNIGVLRAGATLVPVNPESSRRELQHVVDEVRPVAALAAAGPAATSLVDCGVAPVLGHDLELGAGQGPGRGAGAIPAGAGPADVVGGDAPALVGFTSGTTGAPKGAVLSHRNLVSNGLALVAAWRWEPGDRLVHVLPLFHGHGLCVALYTSLLAGASTVVLPGFEVSSALDAVADGATLFFGVPTMYHRLAASGRAGDLSSLRLAVSGSAPLAAGLHHSLAAAGTDVLERYGMTETLMTVSNPVAGERRAGTVGFPLPWVDARVDDDSGELMVRGPQVFGGYLGRPQQTAQSLVDGWFRTGDLSEVDRGYLRVLGRSGELVISGGFNVYPAEVEDVLLRHPAVAEVAVTGTPSDEWGEVVTAWVVPADSQLDTDGLLRFAADELAPYKRPRLVRVVSSLPRNAMGKVRRSELS